MLWIAVDVNVRAPKPNLVVRSLPSMMNVHLSGILVERSSGVFAALDLTKAGLPSVVRDELLHNLEIADAENYARV